MELYKVGEAFIRSSQPLLPFLAPAAYPRLPQRKAIEAVTRHCQTARRPLSTTPPSRDDRSKAPRRSPDDSAPDFDIAALLDGALDGTKGTPSAPATRTSHFKSNSAQQKDNPPSTARSASIDRYAPPPGDSMDDIFAAMNKQANQSTRISSSAGGRRSTADYASLLNPRDTSGRSSRSSALSSSINMDANAPLPIKLGPSVGRTVIVDQARGMDIGRAFRSLEVQCARNSVRKDFNRQRFHERPGLKRKRLRQERWRRRFKENFKGVIGLVQRMRAQGW
ncbi:hypothetical protein LTR78_001689 [Recurvomyces mirabilis]|uniref:Uncharacterized protein n=1 Tax=Recurvomyces mirabilis TaxID=574656 RepID=A0AAE1C527_9PEZI|nr:hypothetical protein LTR78_001689 [Recurvomyces mirabilis]KAK5151741.1 hypothetical protein LTS14_008873 [Recurvomyces mirabilis]